MANRYWVGGTASWDGTAGSKWAATSGGSGGETVPTSADDVFFTNLSTGTVTIATGNTGAKSINCTGFTGTITGTAAISVAGSVTLDAGMTYSHTGTVTFTGTGTLTTAGQTFSGVTVDGVGITVTLGDAVSFALNRGITVTNGTFDTANYNVTAGSGGLSSNNSNIRTIKLGSSTLVFSGSGTQVNLATTTNLTFNPGTSTIRVGSSNNTVQGGGLTFYNFTASGDLTTINGTNTFNNLSAIAPGGFGVTVVAFNAPQTINGTLSTTGTAGNQRIFFRGATYGIAQTLTVNAASLTDADFRDIYIVGAAAPISGTRIGNCGACRGITFSAPKTVYWNRTGAQNWSANGWAATPTGTPSTDNFPLPQDTATFTDAGSVTGTITLDNLISYVPTVDMSGRTSAMTLGTSNATTVYGNWTNGSGTAFTGTAALTFSGGGTQTITSAGKTFSCPITIDTYGGTVQLADALNIGSQTLTVTNGTFDTKNYNVTAGLFSSNNANVRTITLGSSTVTLSTTISFADSTNLTFNAGTSQITISIGGSVTFNAGGVVFNNVSFTNTSTFDVQMAGANTFNNLLFAASSSAGLSIISLSANQIINGTLTVAGATAVRRIFLRSNTLGTPRTLTVNSLSANDCDFRDITIAGAAAGTAPTRAGDCGGNSGITFPAPKTVYWNLSGTQNWSATGWATSSGGTPAVANFPLAQDTAKFDNTGAVGTVTIDTTWNIGTFDASARTSAMTLSASTITPFVYGDWKFGTGVTSSSTTGTITFAKRGTQTITSNGVAFGCNATVDCVTGTVQLADALTLASTRTLTLNSGTFDAVTYNVTSGLCASSGTTARTLKIGSGTWTLSGTGAVWSFATSTNLILYKGTANIVLSDTSTTARNFDGGSLSYNKLTIGGATGISTTNISGNNTFTEFASTKTVAHTIAFGSTAQTFGKWTVTGTAGNVVTLTGTGTSHILAGACTSGIDYLAMGSIGFADTSPGEFYAGANSTGTAGAPVYRTAKPADSTRYWVGGTGNWSSTTKWSTSSGGSSGASVPRSHDDVIFDGSSNATAYTATVDTVTGGIRMKSLTISGPGTSGNVTLAGVVAMVGIHGNVTLPATKLTLTYTGPIYLSGSSTGLTFTTNGVTLAQNIYVNGIGCEWSLGSALNMGTYNLIITAGSFNFSTYNLTAAYVAANSTASCAVNFGSSTLTLSSGAPIDFGTTEASRANLTVTAGTSQINCSSSTATLNGNNQTFYNVSFTSTSTGTRSITGSNTFNNLTLTSVASGLSQLSLAANQAVNGTFTCAGTAGIYRGFVRSDTIGVTRTITAATLSANDCDFRDITIAGGAAGTAPTMAGDCGGNSGITFPAPKTVYRVGTSNNWANTNWSNLSGGSADIIYFPLAQDTAVIDNSTTLTGTLSLAAYNIGALNCSNRTTGITLNYNASPNWYGSHTLGSGVTVSGTSAQTFSGRGTMDFTSAGKTITFPITVDAPGSTFRLGDAFSSSSTITHTRGTFDANGNNLTCTTFASNNSNTRTITMGSGTWTLSGTGTVWDVTTTNGLTLNKNTANIVLSNTSTTARTFSGAGLSYNKLTIGGTTGISTTTISGNNTFTEIASTKTVAHTIALANTTQSVGSWTVKGSSGNVVTVTGTSAASPATLIFTGSGAATASTVNYLAITGIRAYSLTDTWYAGANSTNNGSLGWYFSAAPSPVGGSGGKFFLMFG